MASRSKEIGKLPLTKGPNHNVEITIDYDEGGWSKPRGYYIHVSPLERGATPSGGQYVAFGLFAGVQELLEPTTRFSQKKLDAITAPQETIDRLVAYVLVKNSLELVEDYING